MIALVFILAILSLKFKPFYKVSIAGKELGYTSSKQEIRNIIHDEIKNSKNTIDFVDLKEKPEFEFKLVNRKITNSSKEIVEEIRNNSVITYKYFEVAVKGETIYTFNKEEEAMDLIKDIKEKNNGKNLELSIVEKYTQRPEETINSDLKIAKSEIQDVVNKKLKEIKVKEEIKMMPDVNGIKLATKPVTGIITSRYGERSRIRSSTHTGLDIGASTGTDIKVVSDGVVTYVGWQGSYGKMIKVSHGNGVETWYAHASKMYVKAGDKVKAKDVIGAVGSTGNSTGPHLHFEIRVNGQHVNPQKYLYK